MVPIRRLDRRDLVELVTDVGPVPMNVGAALVLDTGGADATTVAARLVATLGAVPRLRERLVTPPRLLGRPYWSPAEEQPAERVQVVPCPDPGDEDAFLALATAAVLEPFPHDQPLWRALVVPGLPAGRTGVVVGVHHVLTDGMGGLALLGMLQRADPSPDRPTPAASAPPVRRRDLAVDLVRESAGRVRRAPAATAELAGGLVELGRRQRGAAPEGAAPRRWAPRSSLNVPTGPRREVAVVRRPLDAVRRAGHRRGATVNDVLLVATSAALGRVLHERGEHPGHLVVSVPVAGRRTGGPARAEAGEAEHGATLGNRVGVMPVPVPLTGTARDRLAEVSGRTRQQKTRRRGASAALVGPAFRFLAALGVFRWFVDRQRLVTTFLSNLPGPTVRLRLAGATVERIVPITGTAGNVAVAFGALSYAGTLSITVVVDPEVVPSRAVADALEAELDTVLAPA